MIAPEKRPFVKAGKPPPRPTKLVSFWTAAHLSLGVMAAAALLFLTLEGK